MYYLENHMKSMKRRTSDIQSGAKTQEKLGVLSN